MKQLNKILSYSVKIDVASKNYDVKLKIADIEAPVEIAFSNLIEMAACIELLRDESNTFYNPVTGEIHIIWEPVGENDPKFGK
jgi:hypothetical protein